MEAYQPQSNYPQKKAVGQQGSRNSLLLLGVYVLAGVLTYAVVFLLQISGAVNALSETTIDVLNTLLSFFPFYIAALVMIFARTKKSGYPIRSYFQKPQLPAGQIAMLMIIAIGLAYAVNFATVYVADLLESAYGTPAVEGTTIMTDSTLDTAIQYISYCLITPFVEELLFRGLILSDTLPFGGAFAVVTSAVTFALYHMDISQMPFALVVGLACGYLTVRCRSLWPSVGVHFFINTCSILSNTLSVQLSEVEELSLSTVLPVVGMLLVEALILSSIPLALILAIANRKKLFPKLYNGCPTLTAGDKGVNYWFAPWSVVFLLLVAITMVLDWLS